MNVKKVLNNIESCVCAVFLVVMLALLTYQVVLRWLGSSNAWSEEVARYLFIWIVFIGSSMAIQTGSHITISTAVKIWPIKLRPLMELIGTVAWIVFSAIITYIATDFAVRLFNMGTISLGLHINTAIPFSGVAVGYALMTLRIVQFQLIPQIRAVFGREKDKEVPEE